MNIVHTCINEKYSTQTILCSQNKIQFSCLPSIIKCKCRKTPKNTITKDTLS